MRQGIPPGLTIPIPANRKIIIPRGPNRALAGEGIGGGGGLDRVTLQVHDIHLLKGERPGNLPVQQATAFEIIVNQKAAVKAERASFGQ